MVSHALVPAIDPQRNASLSPAIITTWLREELRFQGIILADDFSMGAVTLYSPAAAAVEALNAGVDMIMVWPNNISQVHASILEAVRQGRLSRGRLREAAGRIIAGKIRYGIASLSE
jgi:beta-N-acetylhexosaminidase